MLIHSVINTEADRIHKMIEQYEALIAGLPKGSLICRKGEYYYLKYRENGKICDKYIGKDPVTIDRVKQDIEQRKHYEKMLNALKKEQKTITKLLEELL